MDIEKLLSAETKKKIAESTVNPATYNLPVLADAYLQVFGDEIITPEEEEEFNSEIEKIWRNIQ